MMRRPTLLIVAVLLAGALWIWISRPAADGANGELSAPRPGFLAPDFSLQNAEGQTVTLSELRGQPVVINFWASWCPPCRAEMPALERIDQETPGLALLAVNATSQDSREQALAFMDENGLGLPVLFDRDGEVARRYEVRSLPTTFFIDATGVIQEVVIGGPLAEALLRLRIERLFEASKLQ
jgi:peroxiredoxin